MCGEFGEVTVIIGLVINFLAFVSPLLTLRDTLTYGETWNQSQEDDALDVGPAETRGQWKSGKHF